MVFAVVALVAAGSSLAAAVNRSPKPTITGFSPKRGVCGTKVTITGAHLAGATVLFNRNQAADTRIAVTVPPNAQTGKIAITTVGGTGTSSSSFQVG